MLFTYPTSVIMSEKRPAMFALPHKSRFDIATAKGAAAANSSASPNAASIRDPCGTTLLTSPIEAASSASTFRPV